MLDSMDSSTGVMARYVMPLVLAQLIAVEFLVRKIEGNDFGEGFLKKSVLLAADQSKHNPISLLIKN